MEQRTIKLMTMHKALLQKDDIDRLYEPRKEGRGLASIRVCVDAIIQGLEENITRSKKKKKEKEDQLQLSVTAMTT